MGANSSAARFSRVVVGWSIDSQTGLLVTNALGMALNRRAPREAEIIHFDQEVQFGSWVFRQKGHASRPSITAGARRCSVRQHHGRGALARMRARLLNRRRRKTRVETLPLQSTTTSRSGTTRADVTAPWTCSQRIREPTPTDRRLISRSPTPRKPGQIRLFSKLGPLPYFLLVVLCLVVCLVAALVLGQFVTTMCVFCVVVALFCAVSVVGICSGVGMVCLMVLVMCLVCPWMRMVVCLCLVMVFVGVQRLPLAASAEWGPSGNIVWNDVMGASGTVSNLE
jgi:hypothetical protein